MLINTFSNGLCVHRMVRILPLILTLFAKRTEWRAKSRKTKNNLKIGLSKPLKIVDKFEMKKTKNYRLLKRNMHIEEERVFQMFGQKLSFSNI